MPRAPRVAFVTIGQSPRVDMLPEILAAVHGEVDAVEFGALDGLSHAEVAHMLPPPGEASLATRLRDGTEVVIGKRETGVRLQALFDELDKQRFDAITLLCTGYFDRLGSKTLLIEAQRVVDAMVDAFSLGCRNLGVMLPLARQVQEFHLQTDGERRVTASHYSPYSGDRLEAAARELAACDLVVMHCMGYTEAMRARVAAIVDKPVLLARRIVAGAVQQIV
ncbi:MAG: AroM family protein [Burkholderiaceae bacterium]